MNNIIIVNSQNKQINTSKKNKVRQHVNIYGSNFINYFLQQFSFFRLTYDYELFQTF